MCACRCVYGVVCACVCGQVYVGGVCVHACGRVHVCVVVCTCAGVRVHMCAQTPACVEHLLRVSIVSWFHPHWAWRRHVLPRTEREAWHRAGKFLASGPAAGEWMEDLRWGCPCGGLWVQVPPPLAEVLERAFGGKARTLGWVTLMEQAVIEKPGRWCPRPVGPGTGALASGPPHPQTFPVLAAALSGTQ